MESRSDKGPVRGLVIAALGDCSEMKKRYPEHLRASASAATEEDLRAVPVPKLSFGSRGAKVTALAGKCSNSN